MGNGRKWKMDIKKVNIDLIRPYWRNPRKNDDAVEAVKHSIERYGYNQPIVIDDENVIIVGHTRYKALRELGYTEIAVIKLDLDHEKAKQYRIADNKTSEKASWDKDLLLYELRELDGLSDMKVYFKDGELDNLISIEEMDDIYNLDFVDYGSKSKYADQEEKAKMDEVRERVKEEVREELGEEYDERFEQEREDLERKIQERTEQEMKEAMRVEMQKERQRIQAENDKIRAIELEQKRIFEERSKETELDYVKVECPHCQEEFTISKSQIRSSQKL